MSFEERIDRGSVDREKCSKCPRQRLGDHLLSVIREAFADLNCSRNVPPATARLHVERDRADERGAAPPVVLGTAPAVDRRVANPLLPPRRSRDVAGEAVDGGPVVDCVAEGLDLFKV